MNPPIQIAEQLLCMFTCRAQMKYIIKELLWSLWIVDCKKKKRVKCLV